LWGETVRVAASIHTIGGFSAHADSDGLLHWYRQFESRPPVVLVHGESGAISALGERLQRELSVRVIAPQEGGVIDLHTLAYRPAGRVTG
jgi:metallo-beta-lactamase family protein